MVAVLSAVAAYAAVNTTSRRAGALAYSSTFTSKHDDSELGQCSATIDASVNCAPMTPGQCLENKNCHWFQGHCGGSLDTYKWKTCKCMENGMWTHKAQRCDCGIKECSANKYLNQQWHTGENFGAATGDAECPFGPVARRETTGLPMAHEHFCRYDCKHRTGCSDDDCNAFCGVYTGCHYTGARGGGCFGISDFMNSQWPSCSAMSSYTC